MTPRASPRSHAIIVVSMLCLGACAGTDVGNPVVDLDGTLVERSFAQPLQADPTAMVEITEAWIAVDRIRLRRASDCNGGAEIELSGPFAIDLLAPGALPQLSGIGVPRERYCRFELTWSPLDDAVAGAPPELVDASLYFAGVRADGTPFTLRSERGDELRLESENGFVVDEATSGLFVTLSGSALFQPIDLGTLAADAEGVVRIGPDSNDTALDAFDEALVSSVRLFDDDDGNGELDDDEAQPDQVLAQ